jgi:membrane protease YdiL (CAAX protease family)
MFLQTNQQTAIFRSLIMYLFLTEFSSSIVQILLFTLIPLIWWLITDKKNISFFRWIGLKRIKSAHENKTAAWIAGAAIAFVILGAFDLYMLKDVQLATSKFSGLGVKAIPAVIVYAVFNTSMPEEILFRGFLLKRLSNKFGFTVSNIIQAAVFGLIHGILLFNTGINKAVPIVIFTGLIGWTMGYINEKKADGSILPGWIIHAASNLFSGICAAFLLI